MIRQHECARSSLVRDTVGYQRTRIGDRLKTGKNCLQHGASCSYLVWDSTPAFSYEGGMLNYVKSQQSWGGIT
jgi:hypothetical protein